MAEHDLDLQQRARIQRQQIEESSQEAQAPTTDISSVVGNHAMRQLMTGKPATSGVSAFIQAKMKLDTPGDVYEQEADAVAAQTVARINRAPEEEELQMKPLQHINRVPEEEEPIQMKSLQRINRVPEEEEPIQMKPLQREGDEEMDDDDIEDGEEQPIQAKMLQRSTEDPYAGAEVGGEIEDGINASRGSGQELGDEARSQFEGAMGYDLGNVRVHTDSKADNLSRSIGAKAFTTGSDVFFSSGTYNPTSTEGQTLLGHELTHVVQQGHANPLNKEGE
jgi:hypothetical protein